MAKKDGQVGVLLNRFPEGPGPFVLAWWVPASPGWDWDAWKLLVLKGSKNGAPQCTWPMLSKSFVQTGQGTLCLLLIWISTYSKLIRSILIKQLYHESCGPQINLVDPAWGCASTWRLQAGSGFYSPPGSPETEPAFARECPWELEEWFSRSIYTGLPGSGTVAVTGPIISLSSGLPGALCLQPQPLPIRCQ